MIGDLPYYQVQVSRMLPLPSHMVSLITTDTSVTSEPDGIAHYIASSGVTAGTSLLSAHSIITGANSSLPTPRHRYYALLSPALSLHVWKSRCNSYKARQDGLW
jgi:hypothetical protein